MSVTDAQVTENRDAEVCVTVDAGVIEEKCKSFCGGKKSDNGEAGDLEKEKKRDRCIVI